MAARPPLCTSSPPRPSHVADPSPAAASPAGPAQSALARMALLGPAPQGKALDHLALVPTRRPLTPTDAAPAPARRPLTRPDAGPPAARHPLTLADAAARKWLRCG